MVTYRRLAAFCSLFVACIVLFSSWVFSATGMHESAKEAFFDSANGDCSTTPVNLSNFDHNYSATLNGSTLIVTVELNSGDDEVAACDLTLTLNSVVTSGTPVADGTDSWFCEDDQCSFSASANWANHEVHIDGSRPNCNPDKGSGKFVTISISGMPTGYTAQQLLAGGGLSGIVEVADI